MGMAASQARYLALVARKSNCEYEGQQINQARTVLSNQSANLFNQMLGLQVPVPPSTQDFTRTQYSFTDGINASTISDWHQLAGEQDYNYVVTHHYYTDKYTGSVKQMSDPQVQYSGTNVASQTDLMSAMDDIEAKEEAMQLALDRKNLQDSTVATAQLAMEAALLAKNVADQAVIDAGITDTLATAQSNMNTADTSYNDALNDYRDELAKAANLNEYNPTNTPTSITIISGPPDYYQLASLNEYHHFSDLVDSRQKDIVKMLNDLRKYDVEVPIHGQDPIKLNSDIPQEQWDDFYNKVMGGNTYNLTDYDQNLQDLINEMYASNTSSGIAFKSDLEATKDAPTTVPLRWFTSTGVGTGLAVHDGNIAPYFTAGDPKCLSDLEATAEQAKEIYDILNDQNNKTIAYNSALAIYNTELNNQTNVNKDYQTAEAQYKAAVSYYDSLQKPQYLGNIELDLLTKNSITDDQITELNQVIKDLEAQGIGTEISNCFDADGNYLGGIYTFKLHGKTYYTTYNDLERSYLSGTGNNNIDGQLKLNYYNADYVSTKIEETEKALLETDQYGRFTSIRFENDSITYRLNMETVTDEVAYNDAMNQFYYENAKYDKIVQDINSKTSLIHQQDRQLELRLKQLDTEHNALSQEMEAVKKVVDDNAEKSFKTFGG